MSRHCRNASSSVLAAAITGMGRLRASSRQRRSGTCAEQGSQKSGLTATIRDKPNDAQALAPHFGCRPGQIMAFLGKGTGPLRPSQSTWNWLRQRGFSMQSRLLTAVALGLLVFGASAVAAQAQMYDADGRYSGGQTARRYELF